MRNLVVFIAFFVLVSFTYGQTFDLVDQQKTAVTLSGAITDVNQITRHTNGSVFNQTLTSCHTNTHSVAVTISNGPQNSGSYFGVTLAPTEDSLTFTFGVPATTTVAADLFDILRSDGGSFIGAEGTVTAGTSATFWYYCENYPSKTPLQVRIWSTGTTDLITYDLQVIQYTTNIKTIPAARTLATTAVFSTEDAANIAGENFVHYYHDLSRNISEAGGRAKFVVEATNWNTGVANPALGTAKICVSFTGLVSYDGALPGVTVYTPGDDLTTLTYTSLETPTGCPIYCTQGDISNTTTTSALAIVFDSCPSFGCVTDELWIGVIPPQQSISSTYTVSIRFLPETIVPVGTIPAGNGKVQGQVNSVVPCSDPDDLSCEDYYTISQPSSTSASKYGPYLSLELFAVNNGEATVEIYDGGLGGSSACCSTLIASCTAGDDNTVPLYCWTILHPCNYDTTAKYTATVSSTLGTETSMPIEYALNTFVGSWPSDVVTPTSFTKPSFGTVQPEHYHHYEVTFSASQINTLSYFQAELYSLHEEDNLEFYWKFGSPAGRIDECFSYDGKCVTHSDCSLAHGALENTGFCRYLFLPCAIEESYATYATSVFTPIASDFDGLKVAELQSGTYYFSVRGQSPVDSDKNVKNEYTYTIKWNIQEEIPIFDSVSINNAVYYLDYSQQYVMNLPQSKLYTLVIKTTYVFNGAVTTYVNCDSRAGTCPCGNSVQSCSAGTETPAAAISDYGYECEIQLDAACACEDKLYIAVRGVTPQTAAGTNTPTFDLHKPIPYILTVIIENLSEDKIPTLTASRAGYYHADSIGRTLDAVEFSANYIESNDAFTKYYKISFSNAEDLRNDMFLVDLTIIDGLAEGLQDLYENFVVATGAYSSYAGYLRSPDAVMVLTTYDDCTVHGNCWAGTKADDLSYLPYVNGNYDDVSQGFCRIALQPCALSEASCPNVCTSGPVVASTPATTPFISPAFDRTKEYYLSVKAFPHWYTALDDLVGSGTVANLFPRVFGHLNNIYYHLKLQIIEQTPLSLVIDTPIYGSVGPKQYVHFQYNVATVPANSKLVFEVYRNHNEEDEIFFYVNHWDGTGNATWAGETYDCYGVEGCNGKCELRYNGVTDKDVCTYEVAPCDLKSTGTYFLSVATRTRTAVWTDSSYGVKNIDFTISATHVALVELLGTVTEGVERGTLRDGSSLYYSVTVPSLTSGVLGRILTIELEDVRFGDVLVTVTRDAPNAQCGCDGVDSTLIAINTNKAVFKRYPCEVTDGNTKPFYITVTGYPVDDCNPVGFVLRAFVDNIVEKSIALTQNNTSGNPPTYRYDSPTTSVFTIDSREIVAATFTTNYAAGTVMNVHIEQDSTAQDVQVTLAAGAFVVPAGAAPATTFGPAADTSDCNSAIQAGSASSTIDWFIDSCSVPNTNTKWFLLFSGEQITAESGNIVISITVIPPQAIVVIPATTSYGVPAETTVPVPVDDVAILGRRVITSPALGLGAGETLTFTFTNTMNIQFGSEVGAQPAGCDFLCSGSTCTVEACETISPQVWYFGFENQSANDTLTITRTAKPWTTNTTQTITTLSANVVSASFDVESNGWKYFTFTVPAETNGAYIVEALNGAAGATLVEVTNAIYSPQYAVSPSGNILLGSGAVSGTCGGTVYSLPVQDECCYSTYKKTFAVLGPVTDGQLSFKTVSFYSSNTNTAVSFPTTQTYTIGTQPYKVSYYQFTVPEDTGFYYKFEVTVGSAHFYLSQGRSGTGPNTFDWTRYPDNPDYAVCYGTASITDQTLDVAGTASYEDVVPLCDTSYCSGQYVLTVVPTVNTTVTFRITLSTVSKTLALSGSGAIPVSGTVNIDSSEVYSEYLYTFKNTLDSVSTWVPVMNDPAFNGTYLPQRITFQLSNLRNGSTTYNFTGSSDPVPSFYIDDSTQSAGNCKSAGQARNFDAQSTPYTCLADTTTTTSPAVLRCSVSYCDIPCGSPVYVRAFRQSGDLSSWTFSTSAAVEATNFGTYLSIASVTVGSSAASYSYNNAQNGYRSAVYIKATFNLATNAWVDITLDNVVIANGGSISLDRFDISPTTCFDYSSKTNLATAANGTSVTILADEDDRCIQPDTDFNKFPVYYRVGWDSNANDAFSFRLTFTPRSITPVIDATLTALSPGETYTKSKYIPDGTWQFYKFNLDSDMGYSLFEFSIDSVACIGTDLEVYTSWQENGAGGFKDWDRSNRWSVSPQCSGFYNQAVTASITNSIFGECHVYGGEYRVAIYAPANTRDSMVTYAITATLSSSPFVTIYPGCPYTQTYTAAPVSPAVNEYIPRFELVVDAANRGSKLSIFASLSDVTTPFTLYASKNANPYPSDTLYCGDWSVGDGYYSTSTYDADNIAEIVIPECEFETDIWYLYLVGAPTDDVEVSVWATFDSQYIPVADLSGANNTVSWSATIGAGESQTYKVIVDPTVTGFVLTPTLTVPADECLDAGATCDFDVFYKFGSAGFAGVDSAATVSTGCVSGSCSDALCSVVSPVKECSVELCPVAKEVFFTVSSASTTYCPYVFEVTTVRSTPVNITANADICVAVEDLSEIHYYSFTNVQTVTVSNPDAIDITIELLGACGVGSSAVGVCAATDAVCTFDYCGGVWAFKFAGSATCGFNYGISTPALTFTPITLGTAVASGVAISSYTVTGAPVIFTSDGSIQYSIGGIVASTCQVVTCAGDNVLRAVNNQATTYYFYNATGLIVKAATSRVLTTTDVAVSLSTDTVQHFTFTLPTGISTYQIIVSDLSDPTATISYAIDTVGIPYTACSTCSSPPAAGSLTFTTCGEGSIDGGSCLTDKTFYVSFSESTCATSCGLTFNARLSLPATSTALPTISGNHNTAYTVESDEISCDTVAAASVYQVTVTDILAVSVRNPNADTTVDIAPLCGTSSGSCSVTRPDYSQYSCQVGDICGPQAYCYAPGEYTVTITAAPSDYARYAEFLVVNQWVDLTASATDTIIGAETHFYKVSNAAGSLALSLTISSGPALEFYVFDGCSNLGTGFEEYQICASNCHVWLPTKAKHSTSSVYYVEIISKGIDTVDHPNYNVAAEKTTSYSLTSKIGTSNCAAPPSSGFCASTSFEGINVWANITTSTVWSFTNATAKDQEAKCKFNTLVDSCPPPSTECRQWLKIHACLDTFPQCDASGFQTGICTDVCNKIKDVCNVDLGCCSDQYIDTVDGSTCYNIPAPTPSETVDELPVLDGADEIQYPPSLDTPIFSTIQVYLPPASELFENIPGLKEAVVAENSGSSLIPQLLLCVAFALALFF